MQYDTKKFEKKQTIEVVWHGDDTRLLLDGTNEKIVVKKGDKLKVCLTQAIRLFKYSDLWTAAGDEPVKQPWREAMAKANEMEAAKARAVEVKEKKTNKTTTEKEPVKENPVVALTSADVEVMETKEAVVSALTARGVKVNENASTEELKAVLIESLEPKKEPVKETTKK